MRNIILTPLQTIIAFLGLFAIVMIIGGWCFYSLQDLILETKYLEYQSATMRPLENKKIAMIIAFRNFRDEEYFITKTTLERAGAKITTFSDSLGEAMGTYGGEATIDKLIYDLNVKSYAAVVFVGGSGCYKYFDNEKCHQIAGDTLSQRKILGSICASSAILARAGVLEGKKATVWSSEMDKSLVKILKEEGAIYQQQDVVRDGNVITAKGPAAATRFAQEIIKGLTK